MIPTTPHIDEETANDSLSETDLDLFRFARPICIHYNEMTGISILGRMHSRK